MLAGCVRFDPGAAIEIVPDERWDASSVARLTAAGDCWNLAFGTRFVVTSSPTTDQAVFVHTNDLVCLHNSAGQYTPGVPARIDICPSDHIQDPELGYIPPLFMIVVHEFGHATGIRAEGTGAYSVMGLDQQAYQAEVLHFPRPAFTDEDRALFHDASPDFAVATTCPNTRMRPSPDSGVVCTCN